MVGGTILLLIESIQEIASTAPAAPSKCPVMDFVELIFIEYKWSLKTCPKAFASALSPSGVDVPCMLTTSTSLYVRPESLMQLFITLIAPSPSGWGAVM